MRFFLPLATSVEQAERVHARIANRLEEQGYRLTHHRIARVTYWRVGKITSNTVGESAHNAEIVWGEPITVHYASVESARILTR